MRMCRIYKWENEDFSCLSSIVFVLSDRASYRCNILLMCTQDFENCAHQIQKSPFDYI